MTNSKELLEQLRKKLEEAEGSGLVKLLKDINQKLEWINEKEHYWEEGDEEE